MNDKVRAEFEEVFPKPASSEWRQESNYYCWGTRGSVHPYNELWQAWLAAKEKYEPSTQQQEVEPVAVIGDAFSILWIGRGPIAPIIERNGLKVGDKLYAHPPKPAAQPQVPEGRPTDIEVREAVAAFMKDTQTFALEDCARLRVKRLKAMLSAAKEETK